MYNRLFQWAVFCVGMCVGVLGLMVATSVARDVFLDSSPRMIPYNGVLSFDANEDGVAQNYTGQVDLEVVLGDEGNNVWTETHVGVTVHQGRFTLLFGSVDAAQGVPEWLFDAEEVVLEMAVKRTDVDEPFVAFDRPQRITPAMFALWAAEAHHYKADGILTVNGQLTVNGDTNISERLTIERLFGVATTPNPVTLNTGENGGVSFTDDDSDEMGSLRVLGNIGRTFLTLSARTRIQTDPPLLTIKNEDVTIEGHAQVENLTVTGDFTLSNHGTQAALGLVASSSSVQVADGSASLRDNAARPFCPLQSVSFNNMNPTSTGNCKVNLSDDVVLNASVQNGEGNASAICRARCLNW